MSKVEVVMPQLGESLTEGTIVKWYKKPGDKIKKDETLLEISTDKVDSEIPSPATGIVVKLLFDVQKTVAVRTVIAEIETDESAAVVSEISKKETSSPKAEKSTQQPDKPKAVQEQPQKVTAATGRFYSPLVLSIAREENISMTELENITGSGEGGRVTKKDILSYTETRKHSSITHTVQTPTSHLEKILKPIEGGDLVQKYPPPKHEILQMSNVLQKMSAHMVKSVQTSPHVQAIHECDMTKVEIVRNRNSEKFEHREGFKLTYMPFICEAVVKSLKQFPLVNSSVEADKIILKKFINLGIAVASENGLIVPVIKDADEKNFVGIARAINDVAVRTRAKRLAPTDIEGGTFTITNFGVFGTTIGIPIINQPQVAILGIGTIKKRPVVINDGIVIRSIAYLTLSFDHRIIDGELGGRFIQSVVNNLESVDEKQTV